MGIYTAIVIETIAVQKIYTIEADSEDEAREKAENGETEQERTLREQGVLARDVEDVQISQKQGGRA